MTTAIRAILQSPRVIVALMLREMTTTYGRSPGGYLWVVLEPVAGIALLSYAFSFFLRSPPLGVNFALFYATGILVLTVFNDISGKVSSGVRFSRPLLVNPAVTFMDALLARFILNGLMQVLVFLIVISLILGIFETRTILDYHAIALAMACALAIGLSVGTLNCLVFAFYPLWQRIWAIITRPLFLISGIFFTFESLDEGVQDVLWWNPVVHLIGLMRHGFYPDYAASYVSMTYLGLWIALPSVVGLYFLKRYHRIIIHEL